MNDKVVRVKSWKKFKQLIIEHELSIVYNVEHGVPTRHLKGLRLILPAKEIQYVFIDTAAGDRLRKTGISLHKDRSGTLYIAGGDIVKFKIRAKGPRLGC